MPMLLSRAAIVALLALMASDSARGQGTAAVPNAMQGFAQNRNQPVKIEAAVLEMRDKKKEATFSGNVKVVQGDTTMTSKILVVFYEDKSTQPPAAAPGATPSKDPPRDTAVQPMTPGPAGASSIKRLEAKGDVVVTQKDQVVTGTTAIFDTRTNLITMLGGSGSQVVLTQCQNVVRGDRLLVDMTTGVSRVESDTGRVQAMVVQGQDCSGAPAPTAPVSPPSASAKPPKSR
ncbi:LptA/OstA family protein [Bradyrhizobium septentrionale]|uniref:LPS ABC transporter substrate-binding protein LptA n=1 Tax=Bradyrhizobium septentrionale TaxID=1404411 RepID=A0A973WA33_9BRAD|nr:LptA/OstA family protein [Bradyrhizobium septentrionale]UGY18797.1 LPS ABC transporter substrate-binding protein LptA [Bradyrhizobium septentrionale]UGY27528.1 LPS ABC transporter substrate-binding protein LptA [Bradyrhizobium septentrionale]